MKQKTLKLYKTQQEQIFTCKVLKMFFKKQ